VTVDDDVKLAAGGRPKNTGPVRAWVEKQPIPPGIIGRLRAYCPPSKNEPFEVTFEMQSGISLAHPWINGDALIANLLMRDVLGEDFYTLPSKSPVNLPLNLRLPLKASWDERDTSVYHSSVSLFDTDETRLSVIYKRFDTTDVHHLKSKTQKIPLNVGFFKASMVNLPYVPANTVTFYMNGNRYECERLLRHVDHLGKDRGRGYGLVKSVTFRRMEEDLSLFRDDKAMRPIPVRYLGKRGVPDVVMNLAWHSPYWERRSAEPCIVPGSGFGGNKAEMHARDVDWFEAAG
jgi:CRISPR type IV-associated protein Csf3